MTLCGIEAWIVFILDEQYGTKLAQKVNWIVGAVLAATCVRPYLETATLSFPCIICSFFFQLQKQIILLLETVRKSRRRMMCPILQCTSDVDQVERPPHV